VRPKTLLVLALVVAALAAFIAFFERDVPSTDERKANEKKVFRVEADDITGLAIDWSGGHVELERDAKTEPAKGEASALPPTREWRLTAPMTARGDRSLADKLAGSLSRLEIERQLDGAARADVGLEPPRGRVTWKSSKAQGTLELGGDIPASSDLVAAVAGSDRLLVLAKSIVGDLDRAPGDWRAKEVLPGSRDDIERVRVVPAGGGEEVVLAKKGDGFSIERPIADLADADSVDPLLSDLTSLKVETFLDAPLAPEVEPGLAGGPGRIELSLKGKSDPFVVEIGSTVPGGDLRYVRAGGQTFEARTKLADAIGRAAGDWRSKRWSAFESWKIEHLKASDGVGAIDLARSAGDWLRDGKKIPYTEVGDLIYAVTSARADRLLAGAEAAAVPLEHPRLTLVFADANGGEETLTVGDERPDGVPARASGRQVVLLLPKKSVDDVLAKLAAVRAAKPIESAEELAPAADAAAQPKKP